MLAPQVERLKGEVQQQQEYISQLSQQNSEAGTLQAQLAEHMATADKLRKQLKEEQGKSLELKNIFDCKEKELQSLKIEM